MTRSPGLRARIRALNDQALALGHPPVTPMRTITAGFCLYLVLLSIWWWA